MITTMIAILPPSSLFTALIAATQGVYRRQKVRKVIALRLLKSAERLSPARSIVSELTTFSFAMNPVNRLVDILQSLSPSGVNTGATKEPIRASRDVLEALR